MPARGDPGYDPSRKFRYIWDAPIFNLNCLIKSGGKDVVIDETTWPNESPADMQGRVRGKKCNKGGQNVLVVDAKRRYIYAYTARHSFYDKVPPFTQQGPAEVQRLFDSMSKLVKGSPKPDDDKRRQIWDELPHTSMDNHFSGNNVIKYIGELGGRGTWTTARGRLPEGIPKKYLQCKKEVQINARSKAARYENPVVAVKHVAFPEGAAQKPYSVVHVSFQSTGSTNITCVNALRELKLFVRKRERGRGASKRVWAIEMNEGRALYLKTYSGVDKIDQLLKEWGCKIRTFRWWRAPEMHMKAIVGVMAYSIYEQCAQGGVDAAWKLDKYMSHMEFKRVLERQMCEYKAAKLKYPGDAELREATVIPRKRRGPARVPHDVDEGVLRVGWDKYLAAKRPGGRVASRLCDNNMDLLKKHLRSFKRTHKAVCNVCGKFTFTRCMVCNLACCFKDSANVSSVSCSMDLHSEKFFGLLRCDRTDIFGETASSYKKPTATEVRKNATHMKTHQKKYYEEYIM